MGYNRIAAVHNLAVISAFVEHSHIKTQHICQIYCTVGTSLIRADNHHMIAVDLQIIGFPENAFDKLVSRLYGFKAVERDGVLYAGVVGVKGDNIIHTHAD